MRSALILLPISITAAWAAGCSDEDPVTPDATDAGSDAPADTTAPPPIDAGSDANTGKPRDCTADKEADGIWKHLECTGLYEAGAFSTKKLASDAKPYKPGVEFWSDGAEKSRFVYLPPGEKIDITDFDEWVYPVGTKLWKEFKFGGKRIETRLFTKLPDHSWVHTSYRWTADEADAVRKDGGEKIPGLGPNGGTYEIPSTGQCDQCHTGRKDQVLGFDAVSLGLATATGQTLATLAADGKLSAAPPKTTLAFPTGTLNGDDKAPGALGWLHMNCGPCHNANTNAGAAFKAHFLVRAAQLAATPALTVQDMDAYVQGYCKNAARQEPDAGAPYLYIRGGAPSRSLVSVLSGQRSPEGVEPSSTVQMPPLITHAVDTEGHKLLDAWISALPVCP